MSQRKTQDRDGRETAWLCQPNYQRTRDIVAKPEGKQVKTELERQPEMVEQTTLEAGTELSLEQETREEPEKQQAAEDEEVDGVDDGAAN